MFYIREPSGFGLHTTPAGGVISAATPKQPDSSGGSREPSSLKQVGTDAPTLSGQAINVAFLRTQGDNNRAGARNSSLPLSLVFRALALVYMTIVPGVGHNLNKRAGAL